MRAQGYMYRWGEECSVSYLYMYVCIVYAEIYFAPVGLGISLTDTLFRCTCLSAATGRAWTFTVIWLIHPKIRKKMTKAIRTSESSGFSPSPLPSGIYPFPIWCQPFPFTLYGVNPFPFSLVSTSYIHIKHPPFLLIRLVSIEFLGSFMCISWSIAICSVRDNDTLGASFIFSE